jgi:DNA-binding NarL/FixJ family response regulator
MLLSVPRAPEESAAPLNVGQLGPLLARLHEAVDLDSFWAASVQMLNALVPHHSCSLLYGIVNPQELNARHKMPGSRADRQAVNNLNVVQAFLDRHPQIKHYKFSEVLAEDPSARDRLLAQQGPTTIPWNEFIHLAFWNGSRPDSVLSIRRGSEQGPFTEQETRLIYSFHPIIEAALFRLRKLAVERSQISSIERFLVDLPVPVVFVDSDLKLICASRDGLATCMEWNCGKKSARQMDHRRGFKLPPEIVAATQRLQAETGANPVAAFRKARVPHPTDRALVAQVNQDVHGGSPWMRPNYRIVFLIERSIDNAPLVSNQAGASILQQLSAQERRVALLLADGCNNRLIAEKLGKSKRTVECQLASIYAKLGLKNRFQLVRALL